MTEPLVTCLCVTHERPRWLPWVKMQSGKQTLKEHLYYALDSTGGAPPLGTGLPVAIAPKRNMALQSVETPYFAWFDDDDWSHPERLERGVRLLEACPELVAAGPIHAYKIDARTLRSYQYTTNEHIIFNGAVYRTDYWKKFRFDERLAVAEDTDWQMRGLRGQAYAVVNKVLSSWLCHGANIANRADRIMFHDAFPAQLVQFKAELESNPEYGR